MALTVLKGITNGLRNQHRPRWQWNDDTEELTGFNHSKTFHQIIIIIIIINNAESSVTLP